MPEPQTQPPTEALTSQAAAPPEGAPRARDSAAAPGERRGRGGGPEMTDEERAARRERYQNMTPEERAAERQRRLESMTPEQREEYQRRQREREAERGANPDTGSRP